MQRANAADHEAGGREQRVGTVSGTHRLETPVGFGHGRRRAGPIAQQLEQRQADTREIDRHEQRRTDLAPLTQGVTTCRQRGERARSRGLLGQRRQAGQARPHFVHGLADGAQAARHPASEGFAVEHQPGLVGPQPAAPAPGEQQTGNHRHRPTVGSRR